MIVGSIFTNVHDRTPWPIEPITFGELVEALISEMPIADPESKCEQTCISPAVYPSGKTRSKASALSWNWFAADIDNKVGNFPGSTIDDIIEVMRDLGSPWLIYTTASSKTEAECFRLMFPLDRPIIAEEFDSVWQSFVQMLPMDNKTKDISRIFIVPARWTGRDIRVEFEAKGSPVCVDEIVRRFPATLATPMVATRKPGVLDRSNLRTIIATLNAPYVSEKAVADALLAAPGGRMYRFLVTVAFSAMRKGYAIDAADLEAIGRELAQQMSRPTSDIRHDARSAIAYAEANYIDARVNRAAHRRSTLLPKSMR